MQLQIDCLTAVVGFDHECLDREVPVGALFLFFPLYSSNSQFYCFSKISSCIYCNLFTDT